MAGLSPRRVSVVLTLIMLTLAGGAFLFFSLWLKEGLKGNEIGFFILVSLITGALIYTIIYFFVNRFVYNKILVIYRTIHNLKLAKGGIPPGREKKGDLLSNVEKDVVEWARDRREEIEKLRSVESYRKEFIGNVSHELKTPIFNIQGYILTLLEGGLEDPAINRDYLERAERSVERMITIVEDLETITQLESGQLILEIEPFDLVRLVKEVFESEEMKASARNISIRLHKQYDKPVRVVGDRERIRQVLTNLVVNSVKYGVEGGFTEIRFFDMGENILVEVADNGLGISEQHLGRLFERFYRVDKSRSREQGGSGLGLAIVKHIIEAHKQTINVRSTQGVGSTFAFTLRKAST